jgi:acyl-CoA synthetase (AMP-forming)/AMP-acid ligase II
VQGASSRPGDAPDPDASLEVQPKFSSIADVIRSRARSHGDSTAFITPLRTWTYAQVDAQSSRVAQGLAAEGVGRGDAIACLTRHAAECVVLLLAAGKLGAVLSPMNWRLAARELEYVIGVTRPKVLVADAFLEPVLEEVAMRDVRRRLVTEDGGRQDSFSAWAGQFRAEDPGVEPGLEASAARLFSSGTTGLPKAVDLSHRGMLTQCEAWTPLFGYQPGSTIHLNVLPTFHVSGIVNALWMLYIRGVAVFYPQFDAREWLEAVARHRVTDSFVVPAMLRAMMELPDIGLHDMTSLRSIGYGGSPIDEALLKRCLEVLGCGFLQVFGMTECSGTVTLLPAADHDPGGARAPLLRSVGKAGPHISLRIVDPASGVDCVEGEVGEVWIRSPQNMSGYFGNEEATAAAFPEGRDSSGGWLRSGDAGYLDGGYLFLHDRIKDMIISGGENIYPVEVESVIAAHEAVAEVAVIGVPSEKWGETVKACVVLKANVMASEQDLIAFTRSRLAHYKCPTSVDYIEALPRNPSGKVLKRILRDPYWKGHTRPIG